MADEERWLTAEELAAMSRPTMGSSDAPDGARRGYRLARAGA